MNVTSSPVLELVLLAPLVVVGAAAAGDGGTLPPLAVAAVPLFLALRLANWRTERWTSRQLAARTSRGTVAEAERDAADLCCEILRAQVAVLAQDGKAKEANTAHRIAHLDALAQFERGRADRAEADGDRTLIGLTQVRAQLYALEVKAAQESEQLTRTSAECDRLTDACSHLAEERSRLVAECGRLAAESGTQLATIAEREERVAALNWEIDRQSKQLKALSDRADATEHDRDRATSEVERLASRRSEVEAQFRQEADRAQGLAARLAAAEEAARASQADAYALRQSVKQLEAAAAQAVSLRARLDEEAVARDDQRREHRELQARYDAAIVVESNLRSQFARQAEAAEELEAELARCRAERTTLRMYLSEAQARAEGAEAAAAIAGTELEAARARAGEAQELLAAREQVADRSVAASAQRLGELVCQLETAEQVRFELQARLDAALLSGERAIERTDKLSESLAQTQTKLAERERQLAAGERDEPPPHELELTVAAQAERIGDLERGIAARDAEIRWLLDQQAALWEAPAAASVPA